MSNTTCWVDGCRSLKSRWGMCEQHHAAWLHHFPRKRTRLYGRSDEERFWFYVQKGATCEIQDLFGAREDCWIWLAGLETGGYGSFRLGGTAGNATVKTHRFSAHLAGRNVPDDMEMDHLCRFRPCCNPDHVELVTQTVNTLRGASPVAKNAYKTHCEAGHEFTRENTRISSEGWRQCRICLNRRSKQWRERTNYRDRRREQYEPETGVRGKGQWMASRTHCKEGHPLEGDNLVVEKSGARRCKECKNAEARRSHAKRRAARGLTDRRVHDESCVNGHPRTEENTAMRGGKRRCRVCLNESAKAAYLRKKGYESS